MDLRTVVLLFLFVLTGLPPLAGQTFHTKENTSRKALRYFEDGRELARRGDWNKAAHYYLQALEADSLFVEARIEYGSVQYESGQLMKARNAYSRALQQAPEYRVDLYYMLGVTEWKLNQFAAAAGHFEAYLQREKRFEERIARAKKYLEDSRFAAKAVKEPVPFRPERLSDSINTPNSEYLPTLTADGSQLIYTAVVKNQEDFYRSDRQPDGNWGKGQPIKAINTHLNEGAQSISADGTMLVFTACNRQGAMGSCDLYYSRYENGEWSPVANMGPPINSRAWESQPSLSADGRTLYFVTQRPGGMGGRDIYRSFLDEDGNWSEPENLGPTINTPEHEQAPFIHPDGQTLYFMSKGYPGMGGYDLYYSRLQEDGSWGSPVNLGYPINTKGNEGALFVSLDGQTAYFSTDKADPATDPSLSTFEDPLSGNTTDIFRFELYPDARPKPVTYVKAKVIDAKNRWPLQASVEFVELTSGDLLFEGKTASDGTFLVVLPAGKSYGLNVSQEGYLFASENFDLTANHSVNDPYLLEIRLEKIGEALAAEPGKEKTSRPVVLRNVFFETASAELRPESIAELEKLRQLLEANPSLRIRIQGHTDHVGTEEDNQALSEARAKAVYDYLVEHGIDSARLGYEGFGESRPVATNETPEGRQQNRRTEFVVVY